MTSESTSIEEQLQAQTRDDTKIKRWIVAERRKMENYDREILRTYNKKNQLIEEKRRCCRVKAKLEKLKKCVDKMKEHNSLTSKWGTNNKLKKN